MIGFMNRIGIAGAAGSGKTTVANYLVKKYNFRILGFATPLYKLGEIHSKVTPVDWLGAVVDWADEYLLPLGYSTSERWWFIYKTLDIMDETPIVKNKKNRTLLQFIGTEVGRGLDEDLWTNIFENKVEELGNARIINDNLRFLNEFDTLDRLGFITVFIETPLDLRMERYEKEYGEPMNEKQLSHSSEAYLDQIRDKCDLEIVNTGTIDLLHQMFDSLVQETPFSNKLEVKHG